MIEHLKTIVKWHVIFVWKNNDFEIQHYESIFICLFHYLFYYFIILFSAVWFECFQQCDFILTSFNSKHHVSHRIQWFHKRATLVKKTCRWFSKLQWRKMSSKCNWLTHRRCHELNNQWYRRLYYYEKKQHYDNE